MGEHETELSGPDMKLGVKLSELQEGETLVGHASGEPVLLARLADEVFAIGATCTHYSGPLGEGLVVDDTVRCPWHHACFSLRTGEAVRAPALNPVSCWNVEIRGDTVFVTDKREDDLSKAIGGAGSGKASRTPQKIVIVGAGAAGDAAGDMLRREGFSGDVTIIGADEDAPYDRPNISKDYLAGSAPEEWLPLRSPDFYRENGIDLRVGTQVTTIDLNAHRVGLASGESLDFDRLLLATGAEPVRLPVPGVDLPHVHYLRSLSDCRAILSHEGARRAVIVGASFIGMEVAASLIAQGLDVHVVAPESVPFAHVFGTDLGALVKDLHEEHGVIFHLETTVESIDAQSVTLGSGEFLDADVVVVGIGVRPATGLAEQAGLEVDDGVVVDRHLETSHAGVFAAGDIARWPDPRLKGAIRIEHWVVAQRQGQVAARNMLGQQVAFDAVPFFWTQHYDLPIAYVGHAPEWDCLDVAGSVKDRDCAVAFRKGGQTLAVATIYRDGVSLKAEAALEGGDEETLKRLIPG